MYKCLVRFGMIHACTRDLACMCWITMQTYLLIIRMCASVMHMNDKQNLPMGQ